MFVKHLTHLSHLDLKHKKSVMNESSRHVCQSATERKNTFITISFLLVFTGLGQGFYMRHSKPF